MRGRLIGFDPERMATLSANTAAALEHLRGVTSADPSALTALTRVNNVRFELETLWLPAIARITGDRSMAGWDGEDPDPPPTPWEQIVAGSAAPSPPEPPSEDFLDEDHSYLIDVLTPPMPQRTTGTEWDALAQWQQEWLLVNQPDVVMAFMLRHGNVLTEDQLDELEKANGFAEFSTTFLSKFGIEVGVRWIAIDIGNNSELVVRYMSDDTVHVVVAEKGTFGVSVDVGDIEIGAGIYVRAGQTLVFESEEEAETAIDTLIAASNVTWAEQAVRIWSGIWSGDWRSDTQKEVDALWEEHGVENTDEIGGYLSAHGEINGALSLSGDATLEAGVYSTADGDGKVTRQGVRVSGSISGSATSDGSTVTGGASVVIDAHRDTSTGEEFVAITLAARGGSGVSSSLVNIAGSGVNLSASATQSTVVTTRITVPVNDDTVGNTVDVIESVLAGELPADALEALYDDADITIAVDEVSTETVGTAAGEGVEVESSYTVSQGENVVTYHKSPNGEMYSQNALDAAIDDAREESAYPVDAPARLATAESSSGSW